MPSYWQIYIKMTFQRTINAICTFLVVELC